jgi:hypothetical protein
MPRCGKSRQASQWWHGSHNTSMMSRRCATALVRRPGVSVFRASRRQRRDSGSKTAKSYSGRESKPLWARAGSEFEIALLSNCGLIATSPQLSENQRGQTAFSGQNGGQKWAPSPQFSRRRNAGKTAYRARETAIRACRPRLSILAERGFERDRLVEENILASKLLRLWTRRRVSMTGRLGHRVGIETASGRA